MTITVACAACGTRLRAPDVAVGMELPCPRCQTLVAVPAATAANSTAATAANSTAATAAHSTAATVSPMAAAPPPQAAMSQPSAREQVKPAVVERRSAPQRQFSSARNTSNSGAGYSAMASNPAAPNPTVRSAPRHGVDDGSGLRALAWVCLILALVGVVVFIALHQGFSFTP